MITHGLEYGCGFEESNAEIWRTFRNMAIGYLIDNTDLALHVIFKILKIETAEKILEIGIQTVGIKGYDGFIMAVVD